MGNICFVWAGCDSDNNVKGIAPPQAQVALAPVPGPVLLNVPLDERSGSGSDSGGDGFGGDNETEPEEREEHSDSDSVRTHLGDVVLGAISDIDDRIEDAIDSFVETSLVVDNGTWTRSVEYDMDTELQGDDDDEECVTCVESTLLTITFWQGNRITKLVKTIKKTKRMARSRRTV